MRLFAVRLAVVATIVALAGCENTSDRAVDEAATPETASVATTVRCDSQIRSLDSFSELPDDYTMVGDFIGWPSRNLDPGPRRDDEGRKFAKVGIGVRAQTVVTVSVAPDQADGAYLEYGAAAGTSITFPGCEAAGDWGVFPGGLWVAPEVQCIDLTVEASGSVATQSIGIGLDCS